MLSSGFSYGGLGSTSPFYVDPSGHLFATSATFDESLTVKSSRAGQNVFYVDSSGNLEIKGALTIKGDINMGGAGYDIYGGSKDTKIGFYDNGLFLYGGVVSVETSKFQVGTNGASTSTLMYGYVEIPEDTKIRIGGSVVTLPDYILDKFKNSEAGKGLGKLAFVDDIKKKFNITVSGSIASKNHNYYVEDSTQSYTKQGRAVSVYVEGAAVTARWVNNYSGYAVTTSYAQRYHLDTPSPTTYYEAGSRERYTTYKKAGNISIDASGT